MAIMCRLRAWTAVGLLLTILLATPTVVINSAFIIDAAIFCSLAAGIFLLSFGQHLLHKILMVVLIFFYAAIATIEYIGFRSFFIPCLIPFVVPLLCRSTYRKPRT